MGNSKHAKHIDSKMWSVLTSETRYGLLSSLAFASYAYYRLNTSGSSSKKYPSESMDFEQDHQNGNEDLIDFPTLSVHKLYGNGLPWTGSRQNRSQTCSSPILVQQSYSGKTGRNLYIKANRRSTVNDDVSQN